MAQSQDRRNVAELYRNLVVLARSDEKFQSQEKQILGLIRKSLGLRKEQADAIARDAAAGGFDLGGFGSRRELRELLKLMLFVALADGKISKQEEHYLRGVALKARVDQKSFRLLWKQCKQEVARLHESQPKSNRRSAFQRIVDKHQELEGRTVRVHVDVAPYTPLSHKRKFHLFNAEDPDGSRGLGLFLRVPRESSLSKMFLAAQKKLPMDVTGEIQPAIYGRPVLQVLKASVRNAPAGQNQAGA